MLFVSFSVFKKDKKRCCFFRFQFLKNIETLFLDKTNETNRDISVILKLYVNEKRNDKTIIW